MTREPDDLAPTPYAYRPYEPGDEPRIMELLRDSLGWEDLAEVDWRWKYVDRPGFVPEDVVVALDCDGVIIGCFHSALLPLHLGRGLVCRVSIDGDFVVDPAHRGNNVPSPALQRNDERFVREGVGLRGGFTTEELNRRFYNKRYGYVFVPPASTNYKRPLTPRALRPATEKLGARLLEGPALTAALRARPLLVNCNVRELQPCHITCRADGFHLHEGPAPTADVALTVPYRLVAARAVSRARLLRNTLVDLALARVRVRGLWRSRRVWPGLGAALLRDQLRR